MTLSDLLSELPESSRDHQGQTSLYNCQLTLQGKKKVADTSIQGTCPGLSSGAAVASLRAGSEADGIVSVSYLAVQECFRM